jgi:RNA polymerase sigma-70 factor (ECF subfamily)
MRFRSDDSMLRALRAGDERAFAELIETHSSVLLRVAMTYTRSRAVAEEVVQETWLGVIDGLDRFEGRCSLKTWIFKIVTNRAITRGSRERRSVPFSSLAAADGNGYETSVDPDRFLPPGHWELGPSPWPSPEEGLLAGETRDVILEAIDALPHHQRTVITLRDIEGWPSEEVCDALEVSEGNQRVLLHRARTKVRAALERHFDAVEATVPA